ncbi:MAG: hypothetical protein J6575_03655 [Bifidobacterium sp.]|nr:hypothetical protein [Bifidobacterium sp.]
MTKRDGFAKLSNGFWRSTKIRKLAREHPSALGLYTLAISYCSDMLNDGHLSEDELYYQLGAKDDDLNALTNMDILESDSDSGFFIHDYLQHQTSREKALKNAERHRKSQREHEERKRNRQPDSSLTNQCAVSDESMTGQHLNTQNTQNLRTSLLSNDKSERRSLPSEDEIQQWQPKKEHRQQAMELTDKGYPLIDVDNLAKEFRNSLLSKGIDHYQYRNLDAAFNTWLIKRAESKRDQHQTQVFDQDTALAGRTWHEPEKEPEHKTTYGIGSKRVLNLLGLDVVDPSDWRLMALRDLFNEGKSDEAAMEELRQMEQLRNKETEAVS